MKLALEELRGRSIAVTGTCWIPRQELLRKIRRKGGVVKKDGGVAPNTTILVRGRSRSWKFKKWGVKEEKLRRQILAGAPAWVVASEDFRRLLEESTPAPLEAVVQGRRKPGKVDQRAYQAAVRDLKRLDKRVLTSERAEQRYLRALLLPSGSTAACCICGRKLPADLLVAAHIKPRSTCSPLECRDASNIAALMCVLGCDALYERGWIGVDARGRVQVAEGGARRGVIGSVASRLSGRRCKVFSTATRRYFEWHYEHRFQARLRMVA